MKGKISSAGLLYAYISGYKADGKLHTEQADTYRHIGDGLYNKITEEAAHDDDSVVHIFAVIGAKGKADAVISIFEDEIKSVLSKYLTAKNLSGE